MRCGTTGNGEFIEDRSSAVRAELHPIGANPIPDQYGIDVEDIPAWQKLWGGTMPFEQVTILSGEPGAGKSTLLLALAIKAKVQRSLYITSEETVTNIEIRAARHGLHKANLAAGGRCWVLHSTTTEDIRRAVQLVQPQFFIVDSVQRFTSERSTLTGGPGSRHQVMYVGTMCIDLVHTFGAHCLLIVQRRGDGKMAGPKQLEHAVDNVCIYKCFRPGMRPSGGKKKGKRGAAAGADEVEEMTEQAMPTIKGKKIRWLQWDKSRAVDEQDHLVPVDWAAIGIDKSELRTGEEVVSSGELKDPSMKHVAPIRVQGQEAVTLVKTDEDLKRKFETRGKLPEGKLGQQLSVLGLRVVQGGKGVEVEPFDDNDDEGEAEATRSRLGAEAEAEEPETDEEPEEQEVAEEDADGDEPEDEDEEDEDEEAEEEPEDEDEEDGDES